MANPLEDAVKELQNPEVQRPAQLTALKLLKNALIGHPQKKEELLHKGLVAALSVTLQAASKSSGKRKSQATNGSDFINEHQSSDLDDEVLLQTIMLIGSLAHGELNLTLLWKVFDADE